MLDLVVTAAAVAAGAATQAVVGIGFSLVSAPFLVAVLGAHEGVRTAILLSALLNLAMYARHRADARPGDVGWMLGPAVLATPLLALAVRRLPGRTLEVLAGTAVLVAVALLASGVRVSRARGRGGAVLAGLASAGMNVVSGIGGPPVALYAVNADWAPRSAKATLQLYFLCLNVVALAGLGLPDPAPALFAAMAVGWVIGSRLDRHVPDRVAVIAMLAIAAGGAVVALAGS